MELRSVQPLPTLKKYILIYDWVGRVYEIVGFGQLWLVKPARYNLSTFF